MTIDISPDLGDAILAHARETYPRECCGVLLRHEDGVEYVRCGNLANGPRGLDSFILDPADWVAAEDRGEILAVVHSHPDASANPTHADLVMIERTELPWVIVGYPSGVITQTAPRGQRLDLVERVFHHGIVDCYTLVRDYHWMRLGIDLPEYERADEWWANGPNGEPGQDLYRKNLAAAGFVEVVGREPQAHDMAVMSIRADQPNHAAMFDAERPGMILHHLYGRLSGHDVWGGYWARHTWGIYRHRDVLGAQ